MVGDLFKKNSPIGLGGKEAPLRVGDKLKFFGAGGAAKNLLRQVLCIIAKAFES